MHGHASPHGFGGGARHIALGVSRTSFDIAKFLGQPGKGDIEIEAHDQTNIARSPLGFLSNAGRRGGEWIIRDQATHRHPAWTTASGFSASYDVSNPPYVLVFEVGGRFFARSATQKTIAKIGSASASRIATAQKGITTADPPILTYFGIEIPMLTRLAEEAAAASAFNPTDLEDGRQKILQEIVRRQGQPAFRKALLNAYSGCAFTGSRTKWVLEAAHIVPYLGPRTNRVGNGILLRADIHTLFDLHLVSVNPKDRKIAVSSELAKSNYMKLTGVGLREPKDSSKRPLDIALEYHFKNFVR